MDGCSDFTVFDCEKLGIPKADSQEVIGVVYG